MKRAFRWPLWLQVTLCLTVVTVLACFFGGKQIHNLVSRQLQESLRAELNKTFSIVSAVSIDAVISQDIPVLETVVEQATKLDKDIVELSIENASGQRLVDWHRERATPPEETFPFENAITMGDQRFGVMRALIDVDPMNERIEQDVARVQILLVLILIALACAIIFGIHFLIIRPVRNIDHRLISLAAGDLDSSLKVRAAEELERLAQSVNDLVDASRLQRQRQKELRAAQESLRVSNAKLAEYSRTLEDQVAARTSELAAAVKEADLARQSAETANSAKSSFLANMSHELRTPLNAIIGYSEMLREEFEEAEEAVDPKESIPDLNKISVAGKHLLGVINDVLDLSKIEAGKMTLFLEDFEVNDLVKSIRAIIEPRVAEKSNSLVVNCPDNLGKMHSDLTKVRQCIVNLLANACKFTEKGTVTFSAEKKGDSIIFKVSDTGIGMTEEQMARLFQPFSQADSSTTRKFGGTGLGLTITRHFCSMLGGNVSLSSKPNAGSTFEIALPIRSVQPEVSVETSHTKSAPKSLNPSSANTTTLLVIDDDPAVHDLMRRALSKEGFRVITADSGEQGLIVAREHRPDVITVDIMMPGVGGWETVKRLKADSTLTDIPVVIVSIIEDRNRGVEVGAADFILKPVTREGLLSVLSRYRRSHQQAAAS